VVVNALSRFRSGRSRGRGGGGCGLGAVDIVIGTHRLISKDVRFKDLGLVVIDEEQRFGVLHKEKFQGAVRAGGYDDSFRHNRFRGTLYLSLMGPRTCRSSRRRR